VQRLAPKSFKKYPVFFYYHKQGILSARHPIYLKKHGNKWADFTLNLKSLGRKLKAYTQNKYSDFPVLLLYHTNRGSRQLSLLKINAKLMDFQLDFQARVNTLILYTGRSPNGSIILGYVSTSGILHILFDYPTAYSSLSGPDINTF